MKISYLVTCCSETDTLSRLLDKLTFSISGTVDEIVVVVDKDSKENPPTKNILSEFISNVVKKDSIKILYHSLDRNYGEHKNWGNNQCSGDWIFQIDGDELPADYILSDNLRSILESNNHIELILVPRVNDFRGVTDQDARRWGWVLTEMEFFRPCENKMVKSSVISFPDWQTRIYKNIPDRIKWVNRLHERIHGHNQYSLLPENPEYSLYHDKTIEVQNRTNERYNQMFTEEENRGISSERK